MWVFSALTAVTHCPKPLRVLVMPESDTGWTGWVLLEDTPWIILILWSWVPCSATRGLLLVAGSGLMAQTSHDHTTVSRKEDPQKVDPLRFAKCPKWSWQETTWFGQCGDQKSSRTDVLKMMHFLTMLFSLKQTNSLLPGPWMVDVGSQGTVG